MYTVGQFFKDREFNEIHLLCQCEQGKVVLMPISGNGVGNRWQNPTKVFSIRNITEGEFRTICDEKEERFTRITKQEAAQLLLNS